MADRAASKNDSSPLAVHEEPRGNGHPETKLERGWSQLPAGCALRRSRTERFDVASSLLYSPVVYEHHEMRVQQDDPDDTWLRTALVAFVRGEFGSAAREPAMPQRLQPEIVGSRSIGVGVLCEYLSDCERELVYSESAFADGMTSHNDVSDAVLRVLTHPRFGHRANANNLDPEEWGQLVGERVAERERLLFIVPSCPFKDQNPLRTMSPPAFPDAGEVAFLVGLHVQALALYQVHPFGADWVVLSDGALYADIFGVTREDAVRYRERLVALRNLLNMQGTVSILDLEDMVERFTAAAGAKRLDSFKDRVRALMNNPGEEEVHTAVATLQRGMRANLASREELEGLSAEQQWRTLHATDVENLPSSLRARRRQLDSRAEHAAREYASINLLLLWFDVIAQALPRGLRATVHPKRGQIAVRANGSAYPWNATALWTGAASASRRIVSKPLHDLAARGPLEAVHLADPEHGGLLFLQAA